MSEKASEKVTQSSPLTWQSAANTGNRMRNLIVVLVAVVLSAALALGLRSPTPASSLTSLAASSISLNVALTNNKPTLMEFYANWCTSCQAMAADLNNLKQDYGDRINFVMLNVDNSKWLPELLNYQVDGIPHFVFLTSSGEAIASVIGEQPQSLMAENLDALLAETPLPHVRDRGRTSTVEAPALTDAVNDDPRGHGSQVITP